MGPPEKTAIQAEYIVAFDGKGHRILKDGVLVIEGNSIVFVGKKYENPVDRTMDANNCVVTPGFINTHCHVDHAEINKSFLEDIGNPVFYMSSLFEESIPCLSYETEEAIVTSTTVSAAELIRSGVTTAVVMGTNQPELVSDLLYDLGMRSYVIPAIRSGTWYTEDGKVPVWRKREKQGLDLLEKAILFSETCQKKYHGRIGTMLGPTWTGNSTPELLQEVRRVARRTGLRIQIHASEAVVEFQEMLRRYGQTPIQFLESVDLLGDDLIIGHCIFISGHSWTCYPGVKDLQLLAKYRASVAHCPWVFARRGFILESFSKYQRAGVNMSIGTDACPQNMLLEMRFASILSKISERDSRATTAADVFDAATLGGAKAVGRKDLGRICPGARADLLFFRLDSSRMRPMRDPIRNIVYNAQPGDISEVMIDGKMVMRDGEMEGMDLKGLSARLQKCGEEVWKGIPQRDWAKRSSDEVSKPSYPEWEQQ